MRSGNVTPVVFPAVVAAALVVFLIEQPVRELVRERIVHFELVVFVPKVCEVESVGVIHLDSHEVASVGGRQYTHYD
jgi:hypothetical protein